MDSEVTKTKLIGFGFQLLESVDPNPENFVCAGIVHSRNVQVGCLLRLEPNKQAQVCHYLTLCFSLFFSLFLYALNVYYRGICYSFMTIERI